MYAMRIGNILGNGETSFIIYVCCLLYSDYSE